MKEVDTDLIMRASILLVDSVSACFTEAGELLEAKLTTDQVVEIGELVIEKRESPESWRSPNSKASLAEASETHDHDDRVVEVWTVDIAKSGHPKNSQKSKGSWRSRWRGDKNSKEDSRELAETSDEFSGPITIFKSVGVGLQDVVIACAVVDKAEELERSSAEDNVGIVVQNFD